MWTLKYLFYRFYMDTRIITKDIELVYLRDTLLGGRQYCMKEPLSTLPKARIQLRMYADLLIQILHKCQFYLLAV